MIKVHEQKWYPLLIGENGLLEAEPVNLIICHTDKLGEKTFASFSHYIDFFDHQEHYTNEAKAFAEIVLENQLQKMRFDIDMSKNDILSLDRAESIIDDLKSSIDKVLSSYNTEKEYMIFSSHGETKWSYHVIIGQLFFRNGQECKKFYHETLFHMKEENRRWIDPAVYSSKQQFRVPGGTKYNSFRPKILSRPYTLPEEPRNEKHRSLMILEEGLLSTGDYPLFYPYVYEEKEEQEELECSDSIVAKALSELEGKFPATFSFIKARGPFLLLKRKKESSCPLCDNRVHEGDNPYLLVKEKETAQGYYDIFFDCRRQVKKIPWLIATIKEKEDYKIEEEKMIIAKPSVLSLLMKKR